MRTVYHIFVHGIPKAQPRPRMALNGHVYNPDSAKDWKEAVKTNFMLSRKPVITTPVCLKVCFFLPKPKRMKTVGNKLNIPHIKKPDVDNLLKSTMDAITEAGIWKDDALVFATSADKWYAQEGKIGAQIIIETGF